jgi:hypothetical protein
MDQVQAEASQLTTTERIEAARQAVREHKQTIEALVEAHLDNPTGDRSTLDAAEARLATLEATVRALEQRKAVEDTERERYTAEIDAILAKDRQEREEAKYAEARAKVAGSSIEDLVASTVATLADAVRSIQAADKALRDGVKEHNALVADANYIARDLGRRTLDNANHFELAMRVKREVEQELRRGAKSSFEFAIPRNLLPDW